jgi:hypothetical protein
LTEAASKGVLCEGSTIDIQIIDAIFAAFIESFTELGLLDDDLVTQVKTARSRLPPMRIGSFSQLQEWQQDYAEF